MTTTSEFSSHCPSVPGAAPAKEAPITPPSPARNAPTKNVTAKTTAMLIPSARTIVLVVDTGADDHAHACVVEPEPQHQPDGERDCQHEEPTGRVALTEDREEVRDCPGPHQGLGESAEPCQHLVGEDDRDGDRDQRLAEILTLVPTQEQLMEHQTEQRGDRGSERGVGRPSEKTLTSVAWMLRSLPTIDCWASIATYADEQEQRTVHHAHRAHQSEHQGEPRGDDEQQASERQPVEQRDEELARLIDRCASRSSLREDQDPQGDEDTDGDADPRQDRARRRHRCDHDACAR